MKNLEVLEQKHDWKKKYAIKAVFTNKWVNATLLPIGFGVVIIGYALFNNISNIKSSLPILAVGVALLIVGIILLKILSKKAKNAIEKQIIFSPICYVKITTGNDDNGFYNLVYTLGKHKLNEAFLNNLNDKISNTLHSKGENGKEEKIIYDLFKAQSYLGDPSNLAPKLLPMNFTDGESVYWKIEKIMNMGEKNYKQKFKDLVLKGGYYALYINQKLVPIDDSDLN